MGKTALTAKNGMKKPNVDKGLAAYTLGKDLKSCTYTLKFLCLMVGRQASHQYDTTKLLLILKPQNISAIIFYLCCVVSNEAR